MAKEQASSSRAAPPPANGIPAQSCAGECSYSSIPPSNVELRNLPPSICRVVQDLSLLFGVSQTLQTSPDLKDVFRPVLEQMSTSLGLYRGTLRILNRATGEILIEAACGLAPEDLQTEAASIDEEVIRRSADEGVALIAPDLRTPGRVLAVQELHSTAAIKIPPRTVAFLCVPIQRGTDVMGTLSVYSRSANKAGLEADLRLLTLIAQLIAQAVKLRQHAREQVEFLRLENERLQEQLQHHFRPSHFIGNSRAMQTVYHSIEQVADSKTTVLVRGESGVGKELVASAVHLRSSRAGKAFVKINCAALPESIVESELFGHERGAFTGAIAMRKGRFELAHGGTIFLDEIGELPLSVQAKLLRVLQEREFERVGGSQPVRCDVRVIAATNRPLEEFMEQNRFRLDLYYRLNVFPIYVPPLRERKTDILQLADHFVEKYGPANQKAIRQITPKAIDMFMSYRWPGNVRELENCIERAVLLSTDGIIHSYHLPATLQTGPAVPSQTSSTLEAALDGMEREIIIEALKNTRGNMAEAARVLGLTERIMGLRVKKHRLAARTFRDSSSAA